MDSKDIAAFAKSHRFISVLTVIGFLIIAIVVFEAGVAVGFRKASFASHWQDNYARNFGDPRQMVVLPGGTPNPNGAFGSVESVSLPTFVVDGKGEPEKMVLITDSTVIREGNVVGTSTDIVPGANVVVIGSPSDDGVVEAQLIRILPGQASDAPARPLPSHAQ